jgi:hypothetical protein
MLTAGQEQLQFYQPELFGLLEEWLELVTCQAEQPGTALLANAGSISPHLQNFLAQAEFAVAWDNLRRHNPVRERLLTAFHGWFDAFRTMRLLHHLSDCAFPRISPEPAVAPLLAQAGHDCPATVADQLALLQWLQGVSTSDLLNSLTQ